MTDSTELIQRAIKQPQGIEFAEVMAVIDAEFIYTPTAFTNGDTENTAGSNEGSCKLFAFAQLRQLSESQTLALFGRFYRDEVLPHPEGGDHANIRNFMQTGWRGIHFLGQPLVSK